MQCISSLIIFCIFYCIEIEKKLLQIIFLDPNNFSSKGSNCLKIKWAHTPAFPECAQYFKFVLNTVIKVSNRVTKRVVCMQLFRSVIVCILYAMVNLVLMTLKLNLRPYTSRRRQFEVFRSDGGKYNRIHYSKHHHPASFLTQCVYMHSKSI